MLRIPYYIHGNWKLDAERLRNLETKVVNDNNYQLPEKVYTTFHNGFEDSDLKSFYVDLADRIAKEQAYYVNSFYTCTYWIQVYNKDAIHPIHTHFTMGDNTIISWVHFLKIPDTPCFRFTDGENYLVPEQQEGDIIVYPSYIRHEVISHQEDFNRIVVAGNINLVSHEN